MCQLSNTATNNDMKQGNFGTIYNFKHSKKKKKKANKEQLRRYSRAAAKCTYIWDLPCRGEQRGAACLLPFPRRVQVGWVQRGPPTPCRSRGSRRCQLAPGCQTWLGCASARSCGAMWKHVLQQSFLLRGSSRKYFIYVLSQWQSRGGPCPLSFWVSARSDLLPEEVALVSILGWPWGRHQRACAKLPSGSADSTKHAAGWDHVVVTEIGLEWLVTKPCPCWVPFSAS